ncbi:HAD family phosphatase [Vagococcus sp. BWB3-3]|uniref:HAD family phosphatase n=1 Tax=Vagococcus allomyrinae TaxID=2794353 RepID=A0A940PD42_9ENTE|nr:HAD family phosphatase [Vagococcus allomyrinae]MBP1040568.1 HAD family phosphatase [Vagococcus allomyrinae]
MITTIFFDFDGVITIDPKGSLSFANYIVQKTGLDHAFFLEKYREFGEDLLTGKKNHQDIWPELSANLGMKIDEAFIEEAFEATPINQEVVTLIKELKEQGYQIGLITDNKNDRMNSLIEFHQWADLFDVLAISAQVGSRKNTEEIYHYALAAGKVAPADALFIDNTLKNLEIPKKIGFQTIYFDDSQKDVAALTKELSQLIANS